MWNPMETAPKDGTRIIILTADFGAVDAYWSEDTPDFYSELKGETPVKMGEWVSEWTIDTPPDRRLSCGATPKMWMPYDSAVDRTDAADAARLRWLLDGNGYFLEDEMLCGLPPTDEGEQDKARLAIDAEMKR
ncbi:MAG: hypothetical protein RLW87_06950 [Alphaproteobacteria bacterium]